MSSTLYASGVWFAPAEELMAPAAALTRKSFFIEEGTLKRAKKALGVSTDAEVVSLSLARAADEFWRFMKRTRRTLTPGSIKRT